MPLSIAFLIDELGSGGAQRQICMLALELSKRGYLVEITCYYPNIWYQDHLLRENVTVRVITWRNQIEKLIKVRRTLRTLKADAVISFLKGPNLLNIIGALPERLWKTIIAERTTDTLPLSYKNRIYFMLYRFSDAIVVNSSTQLEILRKTVPTLSGKLKLIRNCVDLDKFYPRTDRDVSGRPLIFGLLASYYPHKRPSDLIKAVEILAGRLGNRTPNFIWCGENIDHATRSYTEEFQKCSRMIRDKQLEGFITLRGPTVLPEIFLDGTDCVCLFSDREGFPNVICEAFASGKPCVATRVGDIPFLIRDGVTGFTIESASPESIANVLMKMALIEDNKRLEMGRNARKFAEEHLSIKSTCDEYLELIHST